MRCRRCDADVIEAVGRAGKRLLLDRDTVTSGPRFELEPDGDSLRAHFLDVFYDAPVNGVLRDGHRAHVKSCTAKARLIDWRGVAQKRRRKLERIFEVAKASSMATDPVATVGLHTNPLEEIAAIVAEPDGIGLCYLHSTIPDEVQDLLEQVEIEAYS